MSHRSVRFGPDDDSGPWPAAVGRGGDWKVTKVRKLMLAIVTILAGGAVALAQPLMPAIFYYASAAELQAGGSVKGALTEQSGQNFKDGSRVEVIVLRAAADVPLVLDVHSNDFDAYLSVYDSDGALIDWVDDGPTGLDPQLSFTPARTGAYLLVVSGFGLYDLGAFEISARASEPVEMVELPLSGAIDDELLGTEPADPEVGYGSTRWYEMVVPERSYVRLQVASMDFDTVLTLFDDYGFYDQNDDAGMTTDSELFLELEPGVYRVAVSAYADGGGPFTLRADRYVRVD